MHARWMAAACVLAAWGAGHARDCSVRSDSPTFPGDTAVFTLVCDTAAPGKIGWDFGDGRSQDSAVGAVTARHAFAASGNYPVIAGVEGEPYGFAVRHAVVNRPTPAAPTRTTTLLYDPGRGKAPARVWCVNQDNHSISVFDPARAAPLAEIPVGRNPRTLALDSLGRIWVANQDDATLSIMDGNAFGLIRTVGLPRASRPYGVCLDPRGGTAYVTLEGTGKLLRIDAASFGVTGELDLFPSPRAIAVSHDGARVLVTRYISPADHGEVADVKADPFSLARIIPLAYEGDIAMPPGGEWGVPNALAAVTISPDGRRAWVPFKKDNVRLGAFVNPDGGLPDFEHTVRTGVAQIDLAAGAEDRAARADLDNRSLAAAVAFDGKGAFAFVPTFTANGVTVFDNGGGEFLYQEPYDAEGELAPDGLEVAPGDSLLFVHYFMGRSLGIFSLGRMAAEKTIARKALLPAVEKESLAPTVLRGKRVFYNAGDRRMAKDRYQTCAVCHLDGASDGRVWDFTHRGEGLRRTTSLLGKAGMGQGPLHWSANFDEIQDFEHDMREAFAGEGFLPDEVFHSGGRDRPLGAPKAGLSPDLDALAAYVASLAQARPSPYRNPDGTLTADAMEGKAIFEDPKVGCAVCHPAPRYTDSGPARGPGGSDPGGFLLHDVGTLRPGAGRRLGDTLTGFDTPTLLGIWESGPYLHDGSAATLMDVITTANPADRHGHTSQLSAQQKDQLVAFLRQIESGPEASALRPAAVPGQAGAFLVRPAGQGFLVQWTGASGEGARLSVYDAGGRRLARLEPEARRAGGALSFRWAGPGGRRAGPGVFQLRLEWKGGSAARRIVLAGP